MHKAGFLKLACSAGVVRRALKVAAVVGTLLALINHGDALIDGAFGMKNLAQVVLTYFVPYAVATYSAVDALRQQQSRNTEA